MSMILDSARAKWNHLVVEKAILWETSIAATHVFMFTTFPGDHVSASNASTSNHSGVTTPVPPAAELETTPLFPTPQERDHEPSPTPFRRDYDMPQPSNGWSGIFRSLARSPVPPIRTSFDPTIQNHGCPVCQLTLVTIEDSAECPQQVLICSDNTNRKNSV